MWLVLSVWYITNVGFFFFFLNSWLCCLDLYRFFLPCSNILFLIFLNFLEFQAHTMVRGRHSSYSGNFASVSSPRNCTRFTKFSIFFPTWGGSFRIYCFLVKYFQFFLKITENKVFPLWSHVEQTWWIQLTPRVWCVSNSLMNTKERDRISNVSDPSSHLLYTLGGFI